MSSRSFPCLAWRRLSSDKSWWTSAMRKSRFCTALPISSSQKPFFVASCVASLRRRSIKFWMSTFTFAKGSAAICAAKEDSILLSSRLPSLCKRSETLCCTKLCWALGTCPAALAAATPRTPRALDAPVCGSMSCCKSAGTVGARLAGRGAFTPSNSARLLTSVSISFTLLVGLSPWLPSRRMARASAIACSSPLRNCERWSQSRALASQRFVKSCRYDWSSLRVPSARMSDSRLVAMSVSSLARSCLRTTMASLFTVSSSVRLVLRSSQAITALSHSVFTSVAFVVKSVNSFSSIFRISFERYLYSGLSGSTPC
mmetsp:Transcript_16846/g.39528  ORF Transcript_16846/g.39528 Transcript_16846/m.39528 type:complete len:315 (+) Transcript_16846:724-1668(+)